jgi:hypothetical protein
LTATLKPAYAFKEILAWADQHYKRTGRWPQQLTRVIPGSLGERWVNIDNALPQGLRGLPGGSSLALLLRDERGATYRYGRLFREADILRWADRHFKRTGRWPTQYSGAILDESREPVAARCR